MKQSKLMSFMESLINIAVGLGVAMTANAIVLPLFGFPITFAENAGIAAIMTVVSIARSFALRRLFEALHIRHPLSPFALAVIAERRRQIDAEGWTAEHDDAHAAGELARAGAAYAIYARAHLIERTTSNVFSMAVAIWPWSTQWWKPQGFRRDLVRAAALIIAEGERFDRQRKSRNAQAPDSTARRAEVVS